MTDHAHEYHDGRCVICYEAESTVEASILTDGPTVLVIAAGRSWRPLTGRCPMSDPVLFDVPAVGTLFDTRPLEVPATPAPELTVSILCPSCGRMASRKAAESTSSVTTCDRCEQAGHLALTLEET